MKAKITIVDNDRTPEEIIAQAEGQFGSNVVVDFYPNSNDPRDLLYFAIYRLITEDQVKALYRDKDLYHQKIQKLRKEWNKTIGYILNSVIMDNEDRF